MNFLLNNNKLDNIVLLNGNSINSLGLHKRKAYGYENMRQERIHLKKVKGNLRRKGQVTRKLARKLRAMNGKKSHSKRNVKNQKKSKKNNTNTTNNTNNNVNPLLQSARMNGGAHCNKQSGGAAHNKRQAGGGSCGGKQTGGGSCSGKQTGGGGFRSHMGCGPYNVASAGKKYSHYFSKTDACPSREEINNPPNLESAGSGTGNAYPF